MRCYLDFNLLIKDWEYTHKMETSLAMSRSGWCWENGDLSIQPCKNMLPELAEFVEFLEVDSSQELPVFGGQGEQ